jgi:hypothetical protein
MFIGPAAFARKPKLKSPAAGITRSIYTIRYNFKDAKLRKIRNTNIEIRNPDEVVATLHRAGKAKFKNR